jgi:SnoaL-like domain
MGTDRAEPLRAAGSSGSSLRRAYVPTPRRSRRACICARSERAPPPRWLASRFSNCESFTYEVIAAGASGDLGYLVGIEHTTASVAGAAPQAYELRVTTIFRRENGEWKAVHRHGDPMPDSTSAREQLARLEE